MVQKTFKQKGLPYVSQLALENSRAMKALVQWNHEHSIRFFRSALFHTLTSQHSCSLSLLGLADGCHHYKQPHASIFSIIESL